MVGQAFFLFSRSALLLFFQRALPFALLFELLGGLTNVKTAVGGEGVEVDGQ